MQEPQGGRLRPPGDATQVLEIDPKAAESLDRNVLLGGFLNRN